MTWKDDLLYPILSPILKGIIWSISRTRLPQTQGTVQLKGLAGPVEVLRDRWGVPHIYAQ